MSISHNEGALSTRSVGAPAEAAFPVVVHEWKRNSREVVRVMLDRYNGRPIFNVRVWYYDGDELKPGRAGIALSTKHLEDLVTGLSAAELVVKELGLIEAEE